LPKKKPKGPKRQPNKKTFPGKRKRKPRGTVWVLFPVLNRIWKFLEHKSTQKSAEHIPRHCVGEKRKKGKKKKKKEKKKKPPVDKKKPKGLAISQGGDKV